MKEKSEVRKLESYEETFSRSAITQCDNEKTLGMKNLHADLSLIEVVYVDAAI